LWRQAIDRTGREILNVDKGHFNDKTEAVVTMSASRALLSTESLVSKGYWKSDRELTIVNNRLLSDSLSIFKFLHKIRDRYTPHHIENEIKFLYAALAVKPKSGAEGYKQLGIAGKRGGG
jgi:hypothetical protein